MRLPSDKSKRPSFFDLVYDAVCHIPKGKVATYGQVGAMIGNPKLARVVGNALHNNPLPGIVPCHRVVNSECKVAEVFAFGGGEVQRQLLEAEGIIFETDGRIDLEKYSI